jgi:hypothetical protein
MRNIRIPLRSEILKDYFSADSVMLNYFAANYKSVQNILENPDKFPRANFDYLIAVEMEFIIETPMEIVLEELNAY